MQDFAQKFKEARRAAGLSQRGVADLMLIPKRTIEDWEGEKRTPPPYVQRFVLNELKQLAENQPVIAERESRTDNETKEKAVKGSKKK